jgi:hypothetical protein
MSSHPLPWNKVRHALGHSITDANGGLVAEAMTEAEADAILAVTNKVPALVEAGTNAVPMMQMAWQQYGVGGMFECMDALRTALAAFKTN